MQFFIGPAKSRGYYRRDGYIYLNADVLTDSSNRLDALDTVFHECRHAYQHMATLNPRQYGVSGETAQAWSFNFDHYIDYDDDPEGYFDQAVEQDASNFANTFINSWLNSQGG